MTTESTGPPTEPTTHRKAWRVVCPKIADDAEGIAAAETRGKAMAIAWSAVVESGWAAEGNIRWGDLRIKRAPEYDGWALKATRFTSWATEEGVQMILAVEAATP